MIEGGKRIRRKSSALTRPLIRSNTSTTYGTSNSDETESAFSIDNLSSNASQAYSSVPNQPGQSLGALLDGLRATIQKREANWRYLREVHEGKAYWFSTVQLSSEELLAAFEHGKMRSRTMRLAVLGMSLSSVLDISNANDFLRGMLNMLQEFDSVTDDKFERRTQQKGLFRGASRPRKSGASDLSMGLQDAGDATYLFTPNMPFELDYFQVFFTLCDLLVETYSKIGTFLGVSPAALAVPSNFPQPPSSSNGTNYGAGAGLSPTLADVAMKVDMRLNKLITMITKDVDTIARTAIRNELSFLGSGAEWWGDES